MFCDKTRITVKSWVWWDWRTSARKMKYVAKAWPDWWDWWKWWDFIFRTNENLNSLIELHTKKKFSAEDWEMWWTKDMHWKNWEDFILDVPVWTKITDLKSWEVFDLTEKNMKFIFAKWWRWGYWNAHFCSSVRKYPDFSELWEPVYEHELEIELMLVADLWIIWLPSAWKSSLINRVSNVKAKTADYHFTTLVPNIWIAKIYWDSLILTDIPWLIEWASEWKWLWFEFLRHISRNSALIHVLDWNSMDIVKDYKIIQNELAKYSEDLANKKQIIAINKSDLLDDESKDFLRDYFLQENENVEEIIFISALTWEWVEELMWKSYNLIKDLKEKEKQKIENEKEKQEIKSKQFLENNNVEENSCIRPNEDENWFIEYKPHLEINPRDFKITNIWKYTDLKKERLENWQNNISIFWYSDNLEDDERDFLDQEAEKEVDENWELIWDSREIWQIDWPRIVQIAKMTNFDQRWWIARLYDVLEKMHIQAKLENKWKAKDWDILKFWDRDKCLVFRG